uniref:NADH-ubiquinone oxidoreductase chain 6 n=1 Tax=Bostrichoidea sp. 9 KM-2017 TaxID=2219283 RepID=A0A346RH30_9COLE|nr:NADH dehydrogenase subunit 6 [Bostrichoidea sp. 9 KM-2017]
MKTTMTLILIVPIMMIMTTHPLIMVIMLIIMSTLTAMFTGTMNNSYWFSYMLFLVMVGGMLVVFIYMTSVASNEKITFNLKPLFMTLPFMLLTNEMLHMNNMNVKLNPTLEESMIKYINLPTMTIILMMVIYLLITLIATIKITKTIMGPLRQKY